MIRYAPVVPPLAITQLKPRDDIAYFMYANYALRLPEYREFFRDKPYVVCDCPIYEGGDALNPERLKYLAREVAVEFLIIPDVINDMRGTMNRFHEYMSVIDSPACTGVVQGKTRAEAFDCAKAMLSYGVKRLAIPNKRAWQDEITRSWFVKLLTEAEQLVGVKWHFLGGEYPYNDDRMAAEELPQVISLDTAEPVNAAIAGYGMHTRSGAARRRNPSFLAMKLKRVSASRLNDNVRSMVECLNSLVTTRE